MQSSVYNYTYTRKPCSRLYISPEIHDFLLYLEKFFTFLMKSNMNFSNSIKKIWIWIEFQAEYDFSHACMGYIIKVQYFINNSIPSYKSQFASISPFRLVTPLPLYVIRVPIKTPTAFWLDWTWKKISK